MSLNHKLNEDMIAKWLIIGYMNSKITRQGNSSAWEEMYYFSAPWPLPTKMLLGIVNMAPKVLSDLTPKYHDG